ncbi:STAS domain-containing protein [Geodermatophilus sp. SYSU D01105]
MRGGPDGSASIETEAGGRVLRLRGEVDVEVVDRLRREHPGGLPPVVAIEAGEVTFLDAACVALLAELARVADRQGRTLVLRSASARVDRVLQLTGVDALFQRPG